MKKNTLNDENTLNNENIKQITDEIEKNPKKYADNLTDDELGNLLKQFSYYYYNTDKKIISDEIFDLLKDILMERNPNHEFFLHVGAPIIKNKVKLPYPMASLNKIKPDTDSLDKFIKKYKGPYVISDKLDGVSALFIKDKKNKLYTRGDGLFGQDISHLIPYVISKNIKFNLIPNKTAIRGELIISKNNFKKLVDLKNARNTVAGLVNAKKISIKIAKLTEFIAYTIVNPIYNQIDQMNKLDSWDFPIVKNKTVNVITNDILSKYLVERRENGKYDIDGIVVIDSSNKYTVSNKNPDYGFAFKKVLTDQVAEATVLEVEWNVSKDGYLKPRVKIEPITLVGVDITYATAFNAKFVVDNKLGPGSIIKLVRSGDVIPHILKVLKPSSSGKPQLPDTPYKWNKTNVDLIVQDIHGAASDNIKIKQITYFFKTMKVKFISEGIITKLVENGYDSIIKIVKLIDNTHKLDNIEGLGEKMITKIFNNIKDAFKIVTLPRLMSASNTLGRGFGIKRTKMITDAFPNILKIDNVELKQKILDLEGFDEIMAHQFISNFDKFKTFFEKLKKIINLDHLEYSKNNKKKGIDNILLKNKKIVFTGFRDSELEEFIENNGGNVSSAVSRNTDIVIYDDTKNTKSSKLDKAQALGIKIMSISEFKNIYIHI